MKRILKKDIPTLFGLEPIDHIDGFIHHHELGEYITNGWKEKGLDVDALRKIVNSMVFVSPHKNVYIMFSVERGNDYHVAYAFMGASRFYFSRPKHFLVEDERL